MGQKTHPTGFRIGINKSHDSTWFANYGTYGEILKEDYKIRKFFENDWNNYSVFGNIYRLTKAKACFGVPNQLDLLDFLSRQSVCIGYRLLLLSVSLPCEHPTH